MEEAGWPNSLIVLCLKVAYNISIYKKIQNYRMATLSFVHFWIFMGVFKTHMGLKLYSVQHFSASFIPLNALQNLG